MSPDVPQVPSELTPAEANRIFYAENAEHYDRTEDCANSEHSRQRLEAALDRATPTLSRNARVLDAGGGSGNASTALVERGFDPLLVDVSAEMASIWERKARAQGVAPRTHIAPLEDFFRADEREWDLIVFSSVLHHLYDPAALLREAVRHLAPGGFIVTVFDPLRLSRFGLMLRRFDYACWLLVKSPGHLLKRIGARLRPGSGEDAEPNMGELAEYHAVTGLDDDSLVRTLRESNMELLAQDRFYDARFAFIRGIARIARVPTAFSLVARSTR